MQLFKVLVVLFLCFPISNLMSDENLILAPKYENSCEFFDSSGNKNQVPASYILSLALKFQANTVQKSVKNVYEDNQKSNQKAIEYFDQYIECLSKFNLKPTAQTYYNKANSYFNLSGAENNKLAIESLDKAIEIEPLHRDSFVLKSRIFIRMYETQKAIQVLEDKIYSFPHDSDFLFLLGSLYNEQKSFSKSLLYFNSLLYSIQSREGNSRYKSYALFYIADINYKMSNYKKAVKYYSDYIKYKDSDLPAILNLARSYIALGEFKLAETVLKNGIKHFPDHPDITETQLELYFRGNQSKAESLLRELESKGALSKNSFYQSLLDLFDQKHQKAEQFLKLYASRNPMKIIPKLALISIYKNNQENDKLFFQLKTTAVTLLELKEYKYSIKLIKELVILSKANPNQQKELYRYYEFLGRCYIEDERYDQAILALQKAIGSSSNDNDKDKFLISLATAYSTQKINNTEESNRTLYKILSKNQKDSSANLLLGINFITTEDFNKAVQYISISIENEPKNPMHYYYRAIAYEKLKKIDLAIDDLKEAIKLSPKNPILCNFLGYIYAENNLEIQSALELIQTAVDLDPENGAYQDSLGLIYYRLENFDKALYHLQLALQITTENKEVDPIIYDHLGDTYYKLKDSFNANKHWKKSLELFHNAKDKNRVQEKINTNIGAI